jgi:hypothetical protein
MVEWLLRHDSVARASSVETGCTTGTDSQNNFWIIIQKEDDDLEDHIRDY